MFEGRPISWQKVQVLAIAPKKRCVFSTLRTPCWRRNVPTGSHHFEGSRCHSEKHGSVWPFGFFTKAPKRKCFGDLVKTLSQFYFVLEDSLSFLEMLVGVVSLYIPLAMQQRLLSRKLAQPLRIAGAFSVRPLRRHWTQATRTKSRDTPTCAQSSCTKSSPQLCLCLSFSWWF